MTEENIRLNAELEALGQSRDKVQQELDRSKARGVNKDISILETNDFELTEKLVAKVIY